MGCDCGKPKCDGHCGVSPAVLQINNPSECVYFHRVEVPASMGDSTTNPPKPGAYKNVLLYYNADGEAYLYSSDGIPTKVTGTTSNYEILTNKPKINGVELVGDKSLSGLGITTAIDNAVSSGVAAEKEERQAADTDLQDQINTIVASSDVVDIVGTYAQLQAYDTSKLGDNDIVKVLEDETHGNAISYYRYNKATDSWSYIGSQGPYYTKTQTDTLLNAKQDRLTAGDNITISGNTISATVPTKTSDLTNDGATGTSVYVEESDITPSELSGEGKFITFEGTTDCSALDIQLNGNTTQDGTPTPDAPIPIETVTGRQTVGIVGKNLYDPNSTVFSIPANVSIDVEGDSVKVTALVNTTSGDLFWRTPIPDAMLEDGKTYTISSVLGSGAYRTLRLQLRNHDGTYAGFSNGYSITYDSNYTLFVVENPFAPTAATQVTAGTTCTISNIQVEEGSTTTAYEPYQGQSYGIDLGSIELCKIGTYQDRIYKENGKWYLHKEIGKVVLNGSEDWHKSSNTQVDRYWYNIYSGEVIQAFRQIYSDKFFYEYNVPTVNAMWVDVYQTLERLFVNFATYNTTTVTDLKTWLASNPTTVYYPLATPTTTEITDQTLIDQLEALAGALGYDGVTNIMSMSPGLPAILSVSTYTGSVIPTATKARAGIVRIGDGIDVDDCGTISVNAQKAPTAFTMQYTEGLVDWQSGDDYELVKKTTGSPAEYIYRADRHYYSGTGVSFLNEKTGVTLSPQELYALLLTGEDVVINHAPLGWAVDNGGEGQYAGNYIDGIRLKRETIASQSGNVVSFNGSAFVTTYIPRSSSYEEIVQDTLGIVISGYEDDGAMVYDLVSIDGFSLYGSLQ